MGLPVHHFVPPCEMASFIWRTEVKPLLREERFRHMSSSLNAGTDVTRHPASNTASQNHCIAKLLAPALFVIVGV